MGDLGEQKGQITRQAAEDALTFYCRFLEPKEKQGGWAEEALACGELEAPQISGITALFAKPQRHFFPGVEWTSRHRGLHGCWQV